MSKWGIAEAVRSYLTRHSYRIAVALGLLTAGLSVLKYGISMSPGWQNLFKVAQNWREPQSLIELQPPQDYILSNAVVSVILGAAGLTQQHIYVTTHVLLALVAIILPFLMLTSLKSESQVRLVFLVLAGGPVAAVLITWVGGYDALGVIGACIAVLARSHLVSLCGWFIFALAHGPLALVGLVAVILFSVLSPRVDRRINNALRTVSLTVAVLLGISAAYVMTLSWGGVTSRLDVYLSYPISYYFNSLVAGMPVFLFSLLGAGWIILLTPRIRRLRATKVLVGIVLSLGLALPLVALDQTRVSAIALFPVVLLWIRCVARELGDEEIRRLWNRYAIAAAIVPVVVVWEGAIVVSGWEQILFWRASFL